MKLTWHIIQKDSRRLWPALALWTLIVVGHLLVDWRCLQASYHDAERLRQLRFFEILFFVLQLLSGYVFAATVVVEDSPAGTSAFWPTRPIAGARLLGAKIVWGFLGFVIWPVFLSCTWQLVGGLEHGEIFSRVSNLFWCQVWIVGMAMTLAAFSPTLARLLGMTLGFVFTVTVAFLVVFARHRGASLNFAPAVIILPVAAVVSLLIQYHLRRERLAATLLGSSVVAALALMAIFSS